MFDPRKTVTLDIFSERLKPYEANVLETRIHVSEALNQAQMAMQDIYAFDPRSRGALNYQALTHELERLGGNA
jgi:cellulose biosynthesis protein BcsQ